MPNDLVYEIREDGDLMWAHHLGREDGTFTWEGPLRKVGTGWSGFKHVFSGGDGIIYVVTPDVPASLPTGIGEGMGGRPASGGDLMWARHVGRKDGSFTWEGPLRKVGTGWGGFKHVFSGGDGIIYAVTPFVEARPPTGLGQGMGARPASGGDLMWARHLGRENGSFTWDGPLKKVGSGWGGFRHVLSGGDGIIYVVTPIVEATLPTGLGKGMGGQPATGGDLMWARHLGRENGSFTWEGPLKKVGTGWGGFKHVLSAGDGIIYVVTPSVEASPAKGVGEGLGAQPASGGDLMWARHVGREHGSFTWEGPLKKVGTGWGGFEHVFSGGDGLSLAEAAREIEEFHTKSLGALTVGSPTEPVRRVATGGFEQRCAFGSIVKPAGTFPDVGDRFHVTVTLAGVRCFGTDDPGIGKPFDSGGTDEPFLITSVYAIDPREKEKSSQTTRIGPDGVGDVQVGRVFGQNRDLAVDIAVPGDSDIALNLQLFDQELVTNPEKVRDAISTANTSAILGGVALLTALVPPAGAVAAAVVAVLKASGLLDAFSDGIGKVIADLFSDDHLGTVDLRITKAFLETLRDNPQSLDRTSNAIGGETYNFPQLPEDDSEAGKGWMFRQEGKGTYRPFFRVVLTEP